MKRLLIIVGLVILGAALVFLNQGVRKSVVPDEDEQAQQSAAPAQKAPPAPTGPGTVLPAEATMGDPKTAKHHIQVGWVYDEENQQKPETLTVPFQAISDYVNESGGTAAAEIVDLDVPVGERTAAAKAVTRLGIRVDGKVVTSGNPSKMAGAATEMRYMIGTASMKK